MYTLNTICFLCIFSVQTLFSWGLTAKMKGHVSSSISQFCVLFRKRRGVEGPVFLSSRNRAVGTRVTGAGGVQEKQSTPSPPDLYGNISKILSFKRSLITVYMTIYMHPLILKPSSRPVKEQPWLLLGTVF